MKNFFHPHLPTLSENRVLRYFSFSALYFAQGIPDGILYFGFPAWMAMNAKTPAEIGAFVGVLIIPWSFKFVMGHVSSTGIPTCLWEEEGRGYSSGRLALS